MPTETEIADYLDNLLRNDEWESIDASTNGVQVNGTGEVEKIAFAVDAANQTIDAAGDWGADLLVTHHGIIWGGIDSVTGQVYSRVRHLMSHDMGLYTSHLPLDAHEEVGNNVLLLRELGCEPQDTFGEYGDEELGYVGVLPQAMELDEFVYRVEETVDFDSDILRFGPDMVRRVAVLTGAGGDMVDEASAAGADVYVSGEPKHRAYHDAREHGVNAVFAGHYHTETFGVRKLQDKIKEEFDNVETTFVDLPTSV